MADFSDIFETESPATKSTETRRATRSEFGTIQDVQAGSKLPSWQGTFAHQRLLLVFADETTAKMENYIEFMSTRCGFYTAKLALNSHLAESETLSRAPVRQIVCLVIFSASQPQRYMKDYLDFLNQFDESVDQLLLYCNLSETETQIDQDLRNQFCSSAFPYRKSSIAYTFGTSYGVGRFFDKFKNDCNLKWNRTVGLCDVLESLDMDQSSELYIKKPRSEKCFFPREIFYPCSSQELIKIAGIESFTNRVDPDTLALYGDFIYLNSRIQKPQALIVLNIKLESGKTNKSMHADWRRLLWLLDKLQFEVKDVQTDASSCSQLEECVKTFADSELHGDSCCLVVLSEGWLANSCIGNISKSMAFGKLIKGKPRLIIIQEYQPKSSEASDAAPKSLPQFLPDAVEAMRLQFRNDKPEVRVHPLSGTVWCQSEASDTESDNATPLIGSICETFINHSAIEDLVSMISIINERLQDAPPTWCVQTAKLFYVGNTEFTGSGSASKAQSENTPENPAPATDPLANLQTMQGLAAESDRLRPILDQNNRPGVALILTEGLFDKVRDYQMFLDFAGFQVISERIDGIGASLREIVTSSVAQSPLAVVLIVKKHQVGAGVDDVIACMSETATKHGNSSLLIYFEILDTGEPPSEIRLPNELPEKFSTVCYQGTRDRIDLCLDLFLKTPRKKPKNCPIVGYNFEKLRYRKKEPKMMYRSSDGNPGWKLALKWPEGRNIRGDDIMKQDLFRTASMRKKWFPKKPILQNVTMQSRALIVQNVVFKSSEIRFGTQNDCQRLTDCLTGLGFRVSIRTNLTAVEILQTVQLFAGANDHGRSCVLAIMSHGYLGKILGCDERTVKEADILDQLSKGSGLQGRSKFVVFQACRPLEEPHSSSSAERLIRPYPDMVIAHCTSPEEFGYRNHFEGSWFVQSLCSVLNECGADADILSVITVVNYMVLTCFNRSDCKDERTQQPWWLLQTRGAFVLGSGTPMEEMGDTNLISAADAGSRKCRATSIWKNLKAFFARS
ncbi:hypothetical protein BOX15_Mlig020397g1 [Macrostomum lignano]|uniref:Caspase family p20 domain-containing protein n=1 Tax=Macrostomum lignano TaxID=282301 RepID=A0A267FQG9_9PLAT|nr:hypothetical protein BOX15_Mlig020397g1 [Macrostomum lignano]